MSDGLKPRAFVKWSEFQKVLEENNTGGIVSSLLMKKDGSLLCLAGDSSAEKVIGALVSGMWDSYEKLEDHSPVSRQSQLEFVMLENTTGKVAFLRISNFIVCLCANETIEFGFLRKKLMALKDLLTVPLTKVYPQS